MFSFNEEQTNEETLDKLPPQWKRFEGLEVSCVVLGDPCPLCGSPTARQSYDDQPVRKTIVGWSTAEAKEQDRSLAMN